MTLRPALAGLLYLGSGLGLGALLLLRHLREREGSQSVTRLHISRAQQPWLLGAGRWTTT